MTVELDEPILPGETREDESRDENAWKKVFWSEKDAGLVGDFLRGMAVVTDSSSEVFGRLAESTVWHPRKIKKSETDWED